QFDDALKRAVSFNQRIDLLDQVGFAAADRNRFERDKRRRVEFRPAALVLPLDVLPRHNYARGNFAADEIADQNLRAFLLGEGLKRKALFLQFALGQDATAPRFRDAAFLQVAQECHKPLLLLHAQRCFSLGEKQFVDHEFLQVTINNDARCFNKLTRWQTPRFLAQLISDWLKKFINKDRPAAYLTDHAVDIDLI